MAKTRTFEWVSYHLCHARKKLRDAKIMGPSRLANTLIVQPIGGETWPKRGFFGAIGRPTEVARFNHLNLKFDDVVPSVIGGNTHGKY